MIWRIVSHGLRRGMALPEVRKRCAMGGRGSTRWAMTVTKATIEETLGLDVRALVRRGALQPGATATVTWADGSTVVTTVIGDPPEGVAIRYRFRPRDGSWVNAREAVPLACTPCTYGGSRLWFLCPGCGDRRAMLYAFGGRFACRMCHGLAYVSTRRSGRCPVAQQDESP